MSIKIDRISSQLEKEISYIIATEVKDQDLKFVTITECRVTNDLSYAKVYYTILDENKIEDSKKAFKDAKGFIRRELANRVNLRHIPELEFIYDESIEYGKKIEEKIKELNNKQ